jgi:capsular polysaccharide transport system permease protein
MKTILKIVFLAIFLVSSYYIVSIETTRYESNAIALLKDLSKKQKMDLGNILLGQSSSTMQDSKILELYIRSQEMFDFIDKKYHLKDYYTSQQLDPLQRLYTKSLLPLYRANQLNFLKKYNQNLIVIYDAPSGTLKLTFIHADPKKAQEILQSIIKHAEDVINKFAKENAKVALKFIEQQQKEKRKAFIDSIKKLIQYQNKHHTIDPTLDVERKITILTDLETELVKAEVEYATKLKTWNPNGREMQMLKANIQNIKHSINRVKQELSGNTKGKELNANVFDFELLKSDMEFSKEIYKQTLINQEETKLEVAQQSKHIVIVAKPTLADVYTYPNKIWDILTIGVLLALLYGILGTIIGIVSNHRD